MKRLIHAATEVKTYRNKRNSNKYLEVHEDGRGHRSVKQYMEWDNGVRNDLGDQNLHRWRKGNFDDLLEDYEEIKSSTSFDDWYDSLTSKEQDEVDGLADDLGLPLYNECSEEELASLHDSFVSLV